MGKLFGTDGVRGVANQELTGEIAYKIGRAGGYYLTGDFDGEKPVVLIGKDTRISGDMLEAALIAGLNSAGIDVIRVGIIPTPGVAYLTSEMAVQGGIMISASHNPVEDNGIKFFDKDGFKLMDNMEEDIENFIFNNYNKIPSPTHEKLGITRNDYSLVDKYINYLVETVEQDFNEIKVVLDCACGAAYHVSPSVLEKLGAEVIKINSEPDGQKINVKSGSTYPEVVKEKVLETSADLGIAHDGDADRLIMVDHKGNLVDGDKIMAVLALDLNSEKQLKGKTLVTTPYSNLGLKEVLNNNDIEVKITKNGDRYVLKEMLDNDYNLGGEKSGHIIFLDYNTTGDGILTAIQMINLIKKRNKSLYELTHYIQEWPQLLESVSVKKKKGWEDNKAIQQVIKKAEKDLKDEGRVFVRASGTEKVIRVMLEGKNREKLEYWMEKICDIIKDELN